MSDRRQFVIALAGFGAALSSVGGAFRAARAQNPAAGLEATPLRDGLALIGGAGTNVVVLPAEQGLLMVDSGAPEHAEALAAFVDGAFGGVPVEILLNTHWHLESTGGNDVFGEAGARIVAHESTRLWMSTEYYVDWQDRTYAPRGRAALPTKTFFSHEPQPLTLEFGGQQIEYGHLREAHTDGDLYVRFPRHNVIAAGGIVGGGVYPVIDPSTGGWIGGMADATRRLLELADDDTLFVPETGPVQRRADLEAQHDMLVTLRDRVEELMRQGKSAEEMVAEGVTADFDARWGSGASAFVSNVYDGLWWGGRLRNSL